MRYAETHRLLGSILVGVCHTDLGDSFEAASGYYETPWQWQRIRDNQQWIAIYNSTDDPHIPIEEPRFVAAQLRVQLLRVHGPRPLRGLASVSRDRGAGAAETVDLTRLRR